MDPYLSITIYYIKKLGLFDSVFVLKNYFIEQFPGTIFQNKNRKNLFNDFNVKTVFKTL